jgi:DNA-binding MarR family transcriptional regulator
MSNHLQLVEQKLAEIPREKEGLRAWLRLISCAQMVEQEIKNMLRDRFDTTLPRFELLAALDRVPEGITMGEVSRWLNVTKGNITGIAERLSEDGYIRREPTPTDRRSFIVTMTARGRAEFKRMEAEYEKLLEEIFAELTLEDTDMFMGVIAKIKEGIQRRHGD